MDHFERFAREIHGLLRSRPGGIEIKPSLNEVGVACSYRVTLHMSDDESLAVEEPKLMAAVSAMCRRLAQLPDASAPREPTSVDMHCIACGKDISVEVGGSLQKARMCLPCWSSTTLDLDVIRRGFSV